MPKKGEHPYNFNGRPGTYPWIWSWDVPTSKGTGTPYVVSVRQYMINNYGSLSPGGADWGCNCAAGKNGHPSCQHRMRVKYDIVTVPNMLANLPTHVRALVAPAQVNISVPVSGSKIGLDNMNDERRLKVAN